MKFNVFEGDVVYIFGGIFCRGAWFPGSSFGGNVSDDCLVPFSQDLRPDPYRHPQVLVLSWCSFFLLLNFFGAFDGVKKLKTFQLALDSVEGGGG